MQAGTEKASTVSKFVLVMVYTALATFVSVLTVVLVIRQTLRAYRRRRLVRMARSSEIITHTTTVSLSPDTSSIAEDLQFLFSRLPNYRQALEDTAPLMVDAAPVTPPPPLTPLSPPPVHNLAGVAFPSPSSPPAYTEVDMSAMNTYRAETEHTDERQHLISTENK